MRNKLLDFDEINQIIGSYVGKSRKSSSGLFDWMYEILYGAFDDGWQDANSLLGKQTKNGVKYDTIEDLLMLNIDGKDSFDRMGEAYDDNDESRMKKIMETEYHRIYCAGELESAKKGGAKSKTWSTMSDDKVRETHDYLEGVSVGIDDDFITYDGDTAQMPGGFMLPQNNINCRCWLTFK